MNRPLPTHGVGLDPEVGLESIEGALGDRHRAQRGPKDDNGGANDALAGAVDRRGRVGGPQSGRGLAGK